MTTRAIKGILSCMSPILRIRISVAPHSTCGRVRIRWLSQGQSISSFRGFDSNLPVFDLKTLTEQVEESVYSDRLLTFFSLCLGLLAALLAAVGLYGVLAYMVARRTREIGIRMAIGAEPKDVSWLVLREVMTMSGLGLLIGLAIAFGLGMLIQSQLYGVKAS